MTAQGFIRATTPWHLSARSASSLAASRMAPALLADSWSTWTSRHEHLHARSHAPPSPSQTSTLSKERRPSSTQPPKSWLLCTDDCQSGPAAVTPHDPEASEVEEWAKNHVDSSEEEDDDRQQDGQRPGDCEVELFVASGPWNSLHTPLRDCEEAFLASQTQAGALPPSPQACCGVRLGMIATFVQTDSPESVCLRRACVNARKARSGNLD